MMARPSPFAVTMLVVFGASDGALACEQNTRFAEFLEFSSRSFVGTVIGYRLDDTSLATNAPQCTLPYDDPQLSAECVAFWDHVVSIQYEVEVPIAGIEAERKYETSVWNPDGCVPKIGERWLTSGWYRDNFSMNLGEMPSAAQVEEWRSIAMGDGKP